MQAALATKSEEKKKAVKPEPEISDHAGLQFQEMPVSTELPFFLSRRGKPAASANADDDSAESETNSNAHTEPWPLVLHSSSRQVQKKCACGGSSSHECEACRAEREEEIPLTGQIQQKCAACEQEEQEEGIQLKERTSAPQASIHRTARAGVDGASQPLPHLDRIQSAFGRHDVTAARVAVGGPAALANARMGSLAYTVGDRIAFSRDPDVNLAVHEAAHVVQQRNGAKLPGGVGHLGDVYEQQADAAAEAVEHGESAEAILDISGNSTRGSVAAVQHRLEVNATRIFEPAVLGAEAAAGESESGGKTAASGKKGAKPAKAEAKKDEKEEEAGDKEGGSAPANGAAGSSAPPSSPPAGSAPGGSPSTPSSTPEAASPSTPGAATPTPAAPGDAGAASAPGGAGCTPKCFEGPKDEPTDAEKTGDKPQDPPGGKSEAQTKEADEPDVPEPDDCPKQQAQVGVPAQSTGSPASSQATAPSAAPTPVSAHAPGASGGGAPAGGPQPATSGAKGGGASGGGGGQASAGEKAGQAPSPIEASIAQSEGQRSVSVTSYQASSKALDTASASSAELRGGVEFSTPATSGSEQVAQTTAASARATQFFAGAADSLDRAIAFASMDVPDQLGAQAESGKAQIQAASEAHKDAVSVGISAARAAANADAALARREVVQQAASFVEQVHANSAAAIAALTASHATTLGQVDALETATLEQVNQIYANGRAQMEGLGVTIGKECTDTGEKFAATYRGFDKCTKNSFWDGDLSQRRAKAQAEASTKTAESYRDTIVAQAKKRARDIVKSGRKQNRCQVITTASGCRQKVDETLAQIIPTIEAARDHAIEQAGSTRATLLATIDSSLQATLRQLDQQEHEQRQMIDDTCYLQQVLQEQMAHSAAASLQGLVTSGASALYDSLFALRSQFASSQAPDPMALDGALTSVSHNIDATLAAMQRGLVSGTAAAIQQLDAALGAGVAAVDRLAAVHNETTSAISGGFGSSMGAISGQDNFAPQRAGFTQMLQQATTGGLDGFQKILGAMRDGCGKTTADSQKSLKQAAADLEKNLRQSKQGLECQITKAADEAASREAPAWKKVIAVLLIIYVVVLVIAVTILTAGAGLGLLAVIILGAFMGAVTSALITIATNLWSNQPWHKGVVEAMVVGAITGAAGGALGFGIGAALGKAAPLVATLIGQTVPKVAVEVASTIISTAVINIGSALYEGKGTLQKFSWGKLAFDLGVALVLHKVGKVAETRGWGGFGAKPAVHVSEPTPTETTPAGPAGPKPAEATPSEAASTKPKPAEATPPEPKPAEVGPETATPAPTAEEKVALNKSASKSGEELSPSEISAERNVASRTKGEPINEPPFTTKKNLPNGHEIKETPDGTICERCSPDCGVYDKEGNLVGETEPTKPAEKAAAGTSKKPLAAPVPEETHAAVKAAEKPPTSSEPSRMAEPGTEAKASEPAKSAEEAKTPQAPTTGSEEPTAAAKDTEEPHAKADTGAASEASRPTETPSTEAETKAAGPSKPAEEIPEAPKPEAEAPKVSSEEIQRSLKKDIDALETQRSATEDRVSQLEQQREAASNARAKAEREGRIAASRRDAKAAKDAFERHQKADAKVRAADRELPAAREDLRNTQRALERKQVALDAEEQAGRGVTKERYEQLRGQTPSKDLRTKFNPPGPKNDPVYGHPTNTLVPDHIVPMKEITQMPGFNRLSPKGQLEVLNFEENFMGMDPNVNSSKGSRNYSEWKGHSRMGPVPQEFRAKMITREAELRIKLQEQINERLPK